MASPTAGGVVLVPFAFSDLSHSELRPAVVLAAAGRALELTLASFASGSLERTSYVRAGKLFTAHASLIRARVGTLESSAFGAAVERVIQMLRQKPSS